MQKKTSEKLRFYIVTFRKIKSYVIYCDTLNLNTHGVDPVDVGRNTGEDGGLLGVVTSVTRHKAGDSVHVVLSVNKAVQRAT